MTDRTARLIRGPWDDYTERCLWETSDGDYIITSSTSRYVAETMAFPSDENATMDNMDEVGWAECGDHAGAMRCAGYEVTTNE